MPQLQRPKFKEVEERFDFEKQIKKPPDCDLPQHRVWGWRKGKYQMGGLPKEASKDRCALM